MLVHKEQMIHNASEIAIIQGTSDINEELEASLGEKDTGTFVRKANEACYASVL